MLYWYRRWCNGRFRKASYAEEEVNANRTLGDFSAPAEAAWYQRSVHQPGWGAGCLVSASRRARYRCQVAYGWRQDLGRLADGAVHAERRQRTGAVFGAKPSAGEPNAGESQDSGDRCSAV